MRLLFLTNFYPPVSRGGYEEWCAEVAQQLHSRGHHVRVLTSRHGLDALTGADPAWVVRQLHLEMTLESLRNALDFFTHRRAREAQNLALLRTQVAQQQPDAIVIWGMWNLVRSVPALAEVLLPGRTVYYMGDYWPTLPNQFENYWNAKPRNLLTSLPKRVLGPLARWQLARESRPSLALAHVLFPTHFMQQEFAHLGICPQHTCVIPGAVDLSGYHFAPEQKSTLNADIPLRTVRLLFVGRLTPEKGVHVALEAVGEISRRHPELALRLTIVGQGEADYEVQLRQLVHELAIGHIVTFVGAQPKEALPAYYQQADLLLFTSLWAEPFGRVIVEAMASGAVVVGSATGGAAEIMRHEQNALLFPPGDASALAAQILRLQHNSTLRMHLREQARQSVAEQFDIHQMASGIEGYLENLLHSGRSVSSTQ